MHYKRDLYVIADTVAARRFRRATAVVSEAADGTGTIRANGTVLPARLFPKDHAQQQERDAARLASKTLTQREKQRVKKGAPVRTTPPPLP